MFIPSDERFIPFLKAMAEEPFDTTIRKIYAEKLDDCFLWREANKQREYVKIIEKATQKIVVEKLAGCRYVAIFFANKRTWYIIKDGTIKQRCPTRRRSTKMSKKRKMRQQACKQRQREYAIRRWRECAEFEQEIS